MTIKGSLESFSLPELFYIIESGKKSGRLTFKPDTLQSKITGFSEIWFREGHFITIIDSSKEQFLVSKIINKGWSDVRTLVKTNIDCPSNKEWGTYLKEINILNDSQVKILFKFQIEQVMNLFDINAAWFEFEETDSDGKIPRDGEEFPWKEITGEQTRATELSLEAMRNFSHWSRFLNEMPLNNNGLQRLINHCNLQFNFLEKSLCDMADGSISLNKIAQKMGVSNDKVQKTALSMILAGMIEEVPLTASNIGRSGNIHPRQANMSAKTQDKPKVSNSLLKNLTSFLKSNF